MLRAAAYASASSRERMFQFGSRHGAMGLRCVYSRETVHRPASDDACELDGSLNCHGYGSSVTVTATFGMVAAAEALRLLEGHGAKL